MVTVFGAVVLNAVHRMSEGSLDQDQAADVVADTLLGGFTGCPAAGASS
jgi:hypothetical protein